MLVNFPEWAERPQRLAVPHRGVVVDNVDPKFLGRVKVEIPELLTGLPVLDLPWMCVWNPSGLGGADTVSSFAVPEIGTELVVTFPYNDIYFGFYSGYWQNEVTHQVEYDTDYPEMYGMKDSTGNILVVNKKTKHFSFTHSSGTVVTIDVSGNVVLSNPATLTITSGGDIEITSGTHIGMHAPRIDINP